MPFWKSLALGALILLSSPLGHAGAESHNCLSTHLRDAIQLNTLRKPLYERLSQGKSAAVSSRLIAIERRLLAIAPLIDLLARPYQLAGIPVLCEEFIDMAEVPEFQAMNPRGKDSHFNYQKLETAPLKKEMQRLFRRNEYTALATYADQQVRALEAYPRYHCMVRHVLESIRRMAVLVPRHRELSEAKGLASSESLSRSVLNSHIGLLKSSAELDFQAAPLQAEGLLIICQDVPHIPWP